MEELLRYANEVIKNNPHLSDQIMELVQLCADEIEQGGSTTHEIDLCKGSIEELI